MGTETDSIRYETKESNRITALDLSQYATGLNQLLFNNGFSEKFVLEKDFFQGKEFDKYVVEKKRTDRKA